MTSWSKDPAAKLDWKVDWADWLDDAETLSTSAFTVTVGDDALEVDDDSHDTTSATVWLTGGTVGKSYRVTNHVVTSAGRTDERSLAIRVVER